MSTPIDGPEPAEPAFPAAHGEGADASAGESPPPANSAEPAGEKKTSGGFPWSSIAVGATAALLGGMVGFAAKPATIEETRFINFDPESSPATVLSSGWSVFEQQLPSVDTFAWCASPSCTLHVQTGKEGDRIVRARLWPFRYEDAPPQTLTVFVNGTSLGTKPLPDAPTVLSFPAVRSCWHKGDNEMRLQFAYAEDPKSKYPGTEDSRKLAAAFDWLEIATP